MTKFNGTGTATYGRLSAVEQSTAEGADARRDANVGDVLRFTINNINILSKGVISDMGKKNNSEVKRIDFGGRVSGEILTLLGYVAQQSLYEKFEKLEIKHAKLAISGETEKATGIIEVYMNEPFFDGAYSGENESEKPFDIETWAEGLGRQIIINFDDKAVLDITESLANLRGDCRPIDKVDIQDWLRSCGRAVREIATTKDKKWVRDLIDEFYWEIVDCGLDLRIRTSMICILIGIELLREVLWEERGIILFERVGKTFGEYNDWLIESQYTMQE